VDQLETPALLVDLDVLERNVDDMAALARKHGVALRPHWKTHKCPEIARMQIARGAAGGTVAKPGEALELLAAGFDDLLIATPVVDPRKIDRVLAARGAATLAALVESEDGARRWSAGAERAGLRLDVLLDVDTGMGRTGVEPGEAAVALARAIAADRHLRLRGVMTHAGHGYAASSPEEIAAIGRAEGGILVRTAEEVRAAGIPCPVVSVGSTPTVRHSAAVPGVTEIRPGNYVFHDGIQVALGVVPWERCALTVLATVTARPARDRVILDAGSKTLSTDRGRGDVTGFGRLLEAPGLTVTRVWEEHGLIRVPAEADQGGTNLLPGDRVRVVPNHACVTVNLHDRLIAARSGRVEAVWRIAARGLVA
jgi:D-serine deaminase-like pyridoxal phosphate-dependent protein